MPTEILIVCAAYLIAKAFGDTQRDRREKSWLFRFFQRLGAEEWFLGVGGNMRWNPALFWACDFWHLMEHVKAWCIVYLAVRFLSIPWPFKLAVALVLLCLIGQLFELLYGYILPFEKKGTIWQWAKRALMPWKREVP